MPIPSVQLSFPPGILYAPGSVGREIKVESSPEGGAYTRSVLLKLGCYVVTPCCLGVFWFKKMSGPALVFSFDSC